jgi:hypothetical protein
LLTVDSYMGVDGRKQMWGCVCACGETAIRSSASLRNGSRSCGCLRTTKGRELLKRVGDGSSYQPRESRDWSGVKQGELVVLNRVEGGGYLTRCSCGKETVKSVESLNNGVRSCGCLRGRPRDPMAVFARHKRQEEQKAVKEGVGWRLAADEYMELVSGPCLFCGMNNCGFIMRLDYSKGYTFSNTRGVCQDCKRARGRLALGEFRDWLGRLIGRFTNRS